MIVSPGAYESPGDMPGSSVLWPGCSSKAPGTSTPALLKQVLLCVVRCKHTQVRDMGCSQLAEGKCRGTGEASIENIPEKVGLLLQGAATKEASPSFLSTGLSSQGGLRSQPHPGEARTEAPEWGPREKDPSPLLRSLGAQQKA